MPCKNFPSIYFFIDKSDFDVILKTCKKIEKPPKPSKIAHNIIWLEIILSLIDDARLTPFVSSINPVINALESEVFKLKNLNIGFKNLQIKSIILLSSKMEIITEKRITNPPNHCYC